MKRKIYSSLVFTFMFAAVGLVTVHADDSVSIPDTNTVATETSTASEVETSTENSYNNITSTDNTDNTLDINKSVKVNKKIKLQKSLNLDSESVKDMTFTADDSTVVKVSKAGTVTGLKTGSTTVTVTSDTDDSVYATVNLDVKSSYTASQLRYMSSIIYSEACGEPYAGKKAVGIVVANRMKSSLFPNTIKGVLYQSRQFTPARNGSLNRSLALYDSGRMDPDCIAAAKEALNGNKTVVYKNSTINMTKTLFFSRYIYRSKFRIAHHMFK